MRIKINDILFKIKSILFLSLAFLLPLNQRISTINIVLLIFFSLLSARRDNIYFKKEFLPLLLLYFLYCFSLFYSHLFQISVIELKASLIGFPIVFILNKNLIVKLKLFLRFFILGCLAALLFCEINALYNSLNIADWTFNPIIQKDLSYIKLIEEGDNFFLAKPFSIIHQTVYFSMYLLFSISILLHIKLFTNRIQYFIVVVLGLGVIQTLNKAGIIILFLVIGLKFFLLIKKKTYAILAVFLLFCFGVSVFVLNPRFKAFNTNFKINNTEIKVKDFKRMPNTNPPQANLRVLLWSSALDLIFEKPLFGIGAGGSNKRLSEVLAIKRQWYDKRDRYNAHNQYLQISLDTGIVGLIVFFSFFYFLIKIYNRTNKCMRMIILNFILIVSINFLFESVLERYSGISFFCLFYCILIYFPLKNNNNWLLD